MGNVITPTQLPVTITNNFNQAQLLSALQQNFAAIVAGLQATQGYCNNSVAPAINLSGVANTEILGSQIAGFSRPSTAYTEEGVLTQTHIPRYEQIDTNDFLYGLLIEEGTTNLLTANQSSVETSLDPGYAPNGTGTVARDTAQFWEGTASIKVVSQAAIYSGSWLKNGTGGSWAVTAGQYYTASAYLRGNAGGEPIGLSMYANDGTYLGGNAITLTTGWQRISITAQIPTGEAGIYLLCFSNDANSHTWWIDGIQIEQKAYATSWITGASSRAAETMIIPSAGIWTPGSWTVEMKYKPICNPVSGTFRVLFRLWINSSNYLGFCVNQSGNLYGEAMSGGNYYAIMSTTPLSTNTTYEIMLSGNGSTLTLCNSGVQIGSASYSEPVGTLPAYLNVGTEYNYTYPCDGIIDDLRISNVAHTITDHQNYISSNAPHPVDANTTLLMEFDQTLRQTSVQRLTNVQGAFVVADALTTNNPSTATHIVPTGWTTAEATIMQAMSELPATGGSVTLLDGTFWIDDSLQTQSFVTVVGQGSSTVIKLKAGIAAQMLTYANAAGNTSVAISNLLIDGNYANQSPYSQSYGAYFQSSGVSSVTITGCTIQNIMGESVALGSGTGMLLSGDIAAIVTNNIIQNNFGGGISANTSNSITISNNTITNNDYGVYIGGATTGGVTVSSNQITLNASDGVYVDATSNHNSIQGNTISGNYLSGISLGYLGSNGASYNNIQGNTIRSNGHQTYGIVVASPYSLDNLITSNDCYTGGTTAGIKDSGTSTNFGAGNRVNSGAWSTTPS